MGQDRDGVVECGCNAGEGDPVGAAVASSQLQPQSAKLTSKCETPVSLLSAFAAS